MHAPSAVRSPWKLTEIFPPEAICVGLEPSPKDVVISRLVRHAVALGHLPAKAEDPIVESILGREDLGSTALGNGVAFPHCQWQALDHCVGVVGLLHQGIPFDAVDGQPVDSIFLTLAPQAWPEQHFDVLGRLGVIGRNKSLHVLLRGCRTPQHVAAFLDEIDPPGFGPLDELARISLSRHDRHPRDPWSELARLGLIREDRPRRDRDGQSFPGPRWL